MILSRAPLATCRSMKSASSNSFSVTKSDSGDQPYALFGGYNSTQIVGGHTGLKTFMNYPNWLETWALKGQGLFYNGVTI